MSATERAEQLKKRGNEYFQKGKYNAAIDMYTEAICLDSSQSTFYSNRALCYSKLGKWTQCQEDSVAALDHDPLNAKANYLQALSLKHLCQLDDAIACFQKALTHAETTKKSKSFCEEILVELRRTKKQKWFALQHDKIRQHEANKKLLAEMFDQCRVVVPNSADGNENGVSNADTNTSSSVSTGNKDQLMRYVEQMASFQEQSFYPRQIPEFFICPVSMDIMMDPVSTPNGVSYERRCIEEHLRKNGAVDPLTRQKLTLDMIRPNKSLRAAIQDFLDKNPWAFEQEMITP